MSVERRGSHRGIVFSELRMRTCLPRASRRPLACNLLLFVPARAFSLVPPTIPGLDMYVGALSTNPLETKVATAAGLAVVGDGIAQRSSGEPYDRARALSFVLFDASYRGGFQHVAFPWIVEQCQGDVLRAALETLPLDATQQLADATPALAAIECTAFNQLVIVPVVYYPLFFAVTGAVQGLSLEASLARARERFLDLCTRNWKFWIPAQFCQFAFLDMEWQVPYTCIMGLVWNVILSASAGSVRVEAPPQQTRGVVVPRVVEREKTQVTKR